MQHFEAIRSHLNGQYDLRHNDPYLISFDVLLPDGRNQGMYLAELEDEKDRKYLRVSTPVGPLVGVDARRCLRFNWEQRVGYLAVSDLDGSPYIHLCENRPYELLTAEELDGLLAELSSLGDRLEKLVTHEADAF